VGRELRGCGGLGGSPGSAGLHTPLAPLPPILYHPDATDRRSARRSGIPARTAVDEIPRPKPDSGTNGEERPEAPIPFPDGDTALRKAERIYLELRSLFLDAIKERLSVPSGRPLKVNLPIEVRAFHDRDASGEAPERAFAEGLLASIHRLVDEEVARRAPFPQGRVQCYWCGSFECPHAVPEGPKAIFAGYGPTGLPVWMDLSTYALERHDPRIDDLYKDPPIPIAIVQAGKDLVSAQLPVYGKGSEVYRILGQVAVGFLSLRCGPRGERSPVALTLQAIEVARNRGRVHLNVLGRLPDGTDLWRVLEEESDSRLADALRAARARLAESCLRARRRREPLEREALSALWRLARNLDRIFRQKVRRTKHAQDRHQDRERPAAVALRDAISARPDEIFRDVLSSTWVVLGPRSRVHIFNDAGHHITSVRYPGETVRRRTTQGKWRVAAPESVRGFREAVERSADADR
jgi:hypothetical protein